MLPHSKYAKLLTSILFLSSSSEFYKFMYILMTTDCYIVSAHLSMCYNHKPLFNV